MTNDSAYDPQKQQEPGNAANEEQPRVEQFNELSEISLEERMAVADQIGIPVQTPGEAAATGTASAGGDVPEGVNEEWEKENTQDEETR